jgi:hypothetical protein
MESNEGNVIDGNQIGQTIQIRQTVAFVGSTELTGCHRTPLSLSTLYTLSATHLEVNNIYIYALTFPAKGVFLLRPNFFAVS